MAEVEETFHKNFENLLKEEWYDISGGGKRNQIA